MTSQRETPEKIGLPTSSSDSLNALYESDIPETFKNTVFAEETVEAYAENATAVEENDETPARHYAQSTHPPTADAVQTILGRLNIPVAEQTYLMYAGYTGELATVLTELGNDVIFTDPMEAWVENAECTVLETHRTTLEACPGRLFERADCVVTFEGYLPIDKTHHQLYEGLRSLTTPHGLLFFESEATRLELQELGGKESVKAGWKPFEKVYDVERVYRQRGDLRAYHMRASESTRSEIRLDGNLVVMADALASLSDAPEQLLEKIELPLGEYQGNPAVTEETVNALTNAFSVSVEEIKQGFGRIRKLHWQATSKQMKRFMWKELVQISPQQFGVLDSAVIEP